MTRFPRQQLVSFFGLLTLCDIQENAEHKPVGNMGVITFASGGMLKSNGNTIYPPRAIATLA